MTKCDKDAKIIKEKTEELETSNELLKRAVMQLTTKHDKDSNKNEDVRVFKRDFLALYNKALEDMFDNPDREDNDIYGYDITVHWHGMFCNCSDGATTSNYIIPAIENCYQEDDEDYL